jgi:hypothetical protein
VKQLDKLYPTVVEMHVALGLYRNYLGIKGWHLVMILKFLLLRIWLKNFSIMGRISGAHTDLGLIL